MAQDFEEGIVSVQDSELKDELRGLILDEDTSRARRQLIGGGFAVLLLLAALSWSYYYYTQTPEKILQQKLLDRGSVIQMLTDASRTLAAHQVNTRQLKEAVQTTLQVASTPLRVGDVPQAPYIPERHLALIKALEGLLRLELEGVLHPDNPKDQEYLKDTLSTLGLIRLEYYENGLLEYKSLSQRAWVEKELQREKQRERPTAQAIIDGIEKRLEQLKDEDSFTIVGMAYTLGKWYRYHNDLPNATRCFEVGRKYIEGYSRLNQYFTGKRPRLLSPLWSEYVGCVEALAHMALDQKQYREARSYFARIFNTPDNAVLLTSAITAARTPRERRELDNLKNDIDVIKYAISFPLELPTYPLLESEDGSINWARLGENLQKESGRSSSQALQFIWAHLSPTLQKGLQEPGPLSPQTLAAIKPEVVKSLNDLIQDPTLHRRLAPDPKQLTAYGRSLLKQIPHLSEEAQRILNRDLLEADMSDVLNRRFVLSEEPRLDNTLSPDQASLLVRLWEKVQSDPVFTSDEKRERKEQMDGLLKGKVKGTVQQLHQELQNTYTSLKRELETAEEAVQQEESHLQRLKMDMESLSKQKNIDLNRINQIQAQEDQALKKQRTLISRRRKVRASLENIEQSMADLTAPLKERLATYEQKLNTLQASIQKRRTALVEQGTPMLSQLAKQIDLREEYITLLKGLRDSGGGMKLQTLHTELQALNTQIDKIRSEAVRSTGGNLTPYQSDLAALESRRHELIQNFDALYVPLQKIVAKIAKSEEKIAQTNTHLEETQRKLAELLGTEDKPGILEQKSKIRTALLLEKPDHISQALSRDKKITQLNEELHQEHSHLSLLLQEETQAKNTLRSFSPDIASEQPLYFTQGKLAPLREGLLHQQRLMEEYETLWRHHQVKQRMAVNQDIIQHNLALISQSLENGESLSENQTRELIRYLQNVMEARHALEDDTRQLKALLENPESTIVQKELESRGIQLEALDMYAMEQAMGLNLSAYQKVFEERNTVLSQLASALKEKENLEQQKIHAARMRNQAQIDLLIPKVADQEMRIKDLYQQEQEVNGKLRNLAQHYADHADRWKRFQQQLQPQLKTHRTQLAQLSQELTTNNSRLKALRREILATTEDLRKQAATITLQDIGRVDDLIARQEEEVGHLKHMQQLKEQENYYRATSIYWIAKTFYEQSQIQTLEGLSQANSIPFNTLEDEHRAVVNFYQEVDPDNLYSNQFQEYAGGTDENRVHYESWIDALEQTALELFQYELPKYTVRWAGKKPWITYLHSQGEQDINSFIASSRFLTGELFLRRGMRFVRTHEVPPETALQARKEFDLATGAFLNFLDFAIPFRYEQDPNQQLTEIVFNGQEFPYPSRHPIHLLNQARLYLATIADLEAQPHQAIDYLRDLLKDLMHQLPDFDRYDEKDRDPATGQIDPILLEGYQYDVAMHPLYASLISSHPLAHEALYRLGKNYHQLALRHQQETIQESVLPPDEAKQHQELAKRYATKAIAYYSQLILTQAYSPYRRAALLKRARLRKEFGDVYGARQDLVALISSPYDQGGSWNWRDISDKGDLPGELDPGYSHVLFELGKLHFENGDYLAASDAFLKAQEGVEGSNEYVIQAKIAYAQSLKENRDWLMAHVLLSNLVEEAQKGQARKKALFHPSLYLDLGDVDSQLGNFAQSSKVLKQTFLYGPAHLLNEGELDLSSTRGLQLLQNDYRDAIHPMALACEKIAENALQQRHYPEALDYFQKAEHLYRLLPWQEDRDLRKKTREAFENYRQEKLLAARAGLYRTQAEELLFETFRDFRSTQDQWRRANLSQPLDDLRKEVVKSLNEATKRTASFQQLAHRLNTFHDEELAKLPETLAKRTAQHRRQTDEARGGQQLIRYQALNHLRETVNQFRQLPILTFFERLADFISRGSVEDDLIEEFVLEYTHHVSLTREDRMAMRPGKGNLDNLMALPNKEERFKNFPEIFGAWLVSQMQKSGLDDLFIPVSAQARILEGVDLYRVALLSHVQTAPARDQLVEIVENYLGQMEKSEGRVSNPETVWRMAEIAASATEEAQDWQRVERFNRFLLQPSFQAYFVLGQGFDKLRAQLALAKALLQLSAETEGDLVFVLGEDEKERRRKQMEQWRQEAQQILSQLAENQQSNTTATTTSIVAKEMLKGF